MGKKTHHFQTGFFVTDILDALVIKKTLSVTFQKHFLGKRFPNRKKVPKLRLKKYDFKNCMTVLSSNF